MLRRVISLLRQDGEGPQSDAAKAALSTNGTDILPGFNLAEELSNSGGGGDSHMKLTGMLVDSLRGVNCRFWSRLGFSGRKAKIFTHTGIT